MRDKRRRLNDRLGLGKKNIEMARLRELVVEFLKNFSGKIVEIHKIIIPLVGREIETADGVYGALYEDIAVILNELLNEGIVVAKTHACLMVNMIEVP